MWGTIPYVLCMMLPIVILCVFPEIATWLPDHLMGPARLTRRPAMADIDLTRAHELGLKAARAAAERIRRTSAESSTVRAFGKATC